MYKLFIHTCVSIFYAIKNVDCIYLWFEPKIYFSGMPGDVFYDTANDIAGEIRGRWRIIYSKKNNL